MRRPTFAGLARGAPLLVAAIALGGPATASGQPVPQEKLDRVLQARSRQLTGRSRVIVHFRGNTDPRVVTGSGGRAGRTLPSAGALVADVDNATISALAGNPQVASIRADHPVFPTLERTGGAIAAAAARRAFQLTGKGVGVAVIDSGITAWHDDLYLAGTRSARAAPRVVHFRDFTRPSHPRIWTSDQPLDEYGHGTHVAGVIAGNGYDSRGARTGVAPGAHLVGLKVLDDQGFGYISDVIAAIDYAIAVKDVYNIRIINLSVASGVFESYNTDPLARAARRAVEAGIVVIAAAGNLGADEHGIGQWGGITCPGNAPWVLTVGAANHEGTGARGDDTLPRFSSRGPTGIDFAAKPDLVAPGVGTESLADPHSTLYARYPDYLIDGTRQTAYKPYLSLSGTSMAAPVVTGTVALMLEANPDLTPNAVKALLQYTAEVRDGESFLAQGAGLLNTLGAIRLARFFADPASGPPQPGDVIEHESVAWSRHLIWGNHRITAGIPLPDANAWALDVTWGSEATSGGHPIVWGVQAANIVWSTQCGGTNCTGVIWGSRAEDGRIWGTAEEGDTIVWSTNIVWSTGAVEQVLWPAPALR